MASNNSDEDNTASRDWPSQLARDQWMEERATAVRAHTFHNDLVLIVNKDMVDMGNAALKYGMLLNGGALIALLAMVGALKSSERAYNTSTLVDSMSWFAYGLGLMGCAIVFSYFAHMFSVKRYTNQIKTWTHPYTEHTCMSRFSHYACEVLRYITIAFAVAGFTDFIVGLFAIRSALLAMN